MSNQNDYSSSSSKKSGKKHGHHYDKYGRKKHSHRSGASSTTMSTDDEGTMPNYGAGYESFDLNCGDARTKGRESHEPREYRPEEEDEEEFSQKLLSAETSAKWETVELICSATMTRQEMAKQLESGSGTIEFSLANGRMAYGERTCAADFATTLAVDKKGKPLKSQPVAKSLDIVKSIWLEDIHAPGLDSEKTMINTNVDRFASEGFHGESKHVNKMVLTSQLQNMKQKRIKLLDRYIDNHTMLFQADNLGMTPEKMRADIKPMDEHYSSVDIQSPMIGLFNKLHPNAQILEATPNMGSRVRMRTKTALKYAAKTETHMKSQISYANITNGDGLVIRLERSIPTNKLEKHQEFVKNARAGNKGVGEAYLPFASSFDALGQGQDELKVEFRAIVKYLKGDKEIDLGF